MAWVQQRQRADGGSSVRVDWRTVGGRTGVRQHETFSAGTDAQNRACAEDLGLLHDCHTISLARCSSQDA